MKKLHIALSAAVICGAASMAASAAWAQTQPTYPIAQLGGCADQQSCHAFCDQPANMVACTAYGSQHGLVPAGQAATAQQFAAILAQGGGPGGCTSGDACDAYCSTIRNLGECISFAKSHSFTNQDISDGEKVYSYIQSGGSLPGNCASRDACESYCSQSQHMQECFAVFSKIGIDHGPDGHGPRGPAGPGHEGQTGFSPEMLQRFQAALQSGKAPAGCSDLMTCEQYCSDPSHGAACQIFSQAMGFGNDNANEQVRRQQPPSPGGCDSKDSCDAYCSQPSHSDECKAYFSSLGNWQAGSLGPNEQMPNASGTPQQGGPQNDPGKACGQDEEWNGSSCVKSHWQDSSTNQASTSTQN